MLEFKGQFVIVFKRPADNLIKQDCKVWLLTDTVGIFEPEDARKFWGYAGAMAFLTARHADGTLFGFEVEQITKGNGYDV